jgi:hypothetical protein
MKSKKLGIIVPHRNRLLHLKEFLNRIRRHLSRAEIEYEIFVVNQDDAHQFNRGMLLNIGFTFAEKARCDYVVFHDVDMVPLYVDYSYCDHPLHLATEFHNDNGGRVLFDEYFGGVTMFPVEMFRKINGYSNKYWGWGYEDTDLLFRCKEHFIPLDTLKLKNQGRPGKSLKFNGHNSMVKCKNTIDWTTDKTFFVNFYPEMVLDHNKDRDDYTVFSVPGYDFAICYNSFSRYNFCAFDSELNAIYVNSKIKTTYRTNLTVVMDAFEKVFKVYQDGVLLGQTEPYKRLYNYRSEPEFYLGVGKPDRENITNYFKGYIDTFAVWDTCLKEEEVESISKNETHFLTKSFKNYKSEKDLSLYYDANKIWNYKLTNLAKKGNDGEIVNCEIVDLDFPEYTEIQIPHRRYSTFISLKHEENGFENNTWKQKATRYNQLRFLNEIAKHTSLITTDGLSNLEYIKYGVRIDEEINYINVGI